MREDSEGNLTTGHEVSTVTRSETRLIKEVHEAKAHDYQGAWKTYQRLRQHHQFKGTRAQVEQVIHNYDLCKKSKAPRHKPYRELRPLQIPDTPWHSISLDFITGLPPSTEPLTQTVYDSILVMVDRLTKYSYFIPFVKDGNTLQFVYMFIRNIVANHRMPRELISDRDKLFTSHFWQALTARLGVRHRLSTAFHPQTDGQTERTNQTLEQDLRFYVNYPQNDWVQLLPLAQFAYNSAFNESTKKTPMYANYGYTPTVYGEASEAKDAPTATKAAEQLKQLHEELEIDLQFIQQRITRYANKRKMKGPSFKKGDKIYLARKNIKSKRPSEKLDYKQLRPFKIKRKILDTNYELLLPRLIQIHPIFHISLLEPASPRAKLDETTKLEDEDEEEQEVEKILDHRGEGPQIEYLMK